MRKTKITGAEVDVAYKSYQQRVSTHNDDIKPPEFKCETMKC